MVNGESLVLKGFFSMYISLKYNTRFLLKERLAYVRGTF